MKKILFFFVFVLVIYMWLSSCSPKESESDEDAPRANPVISTFENEPENTEDAGEEYIDSFVFLGESTTYHLKSRGVLSGGTETTQVWAPKSGTLMLSPSTSSCRIIYPETNEELDFSEALERKQPKRILLTFGLNGIISNMNRGKSYFQSCYQSLIDTIKEASPGTEIVIQSCFPVAENMDTASFGVNVKKLNSYIDTLNTWSEELSRKNSLVFINSNAFFKNSNGALKKEYQSGDGYHLNAQAYKDMLRYIRTHVPKESSR